MTHRLCSRIIDDQPQAYAALNWDSILHGNAEYWVNIRSLQSFPIRLLATCTNIMLTPMLHTAALRSRKTLATLMYIESSRLCRFYP